MRVAYTYKDTIYLLCIAVHSSQYIIHAKIGNEHGKESTYHIDMVETRFVERPNGTQKDTNGKQEISEIAVLHRFHATFHVTNT